MLTNGTLEHHAGDEDQFVVDQHGAACGG